MYNEYLTKTHVPQEVCLCSSLSNFIILKPTTTDLLGKKFGGNLKDLLAKQYAIAILDSSKEPFSEQFLKYLFFLV